MKPIRISLIVIIVAAIAYLLLANTFSKPRDQGPSNITAIEQPSASTSASEETLPSIPPQPAVSTTVALASKPTNNLPSAEINTGATSTNELTTILALLLSPETDYMKKRSLFQKLRESGKLDEALEALKKAAESHPDDARYPATLGELILQKLAVMSRQGAAMNQMGLLGMQADLYFDNALKLEPENWEAQFHKAAAMAHWPAELNKGDEVISRLSNLIDQQERSPSRPEFVNTYALLGDYYQKLGQSDHALAAWQLGLQKFPGDQILTSKVTSFRQ